MWGSTLLGRIYNDLGQPQLARQELERELGTARTLDEVQTTVPHLGQLARSLAALRLEEETAAIIEEFLTLLRRTPSGHPYSIPPLLFACHWLAQQRARLGSFERARECLQHLERIEALFHSLESSGALAEARGIEGLYNGEVTVAIGWFRQAASRWSDLGQLYNQACTLNLLGQALVQAGEPEQAQVVFDQGRGIIERLVGQLEGSPEMNVQKPQPQQQPQQQPQK